MRTFLVLLKLELKRMTKSIPYFLTGAIVLVLLAGTIAFSASRMLYGNKAVGRITVGVVMPKEDKLASMAISMIGSMDSVDSLCSFEYVEEEEGMALLKKGDLFALLKVPENMIQGIMNGTNTPATVVFSENAGLEASVFKELTEAGTVMLGTSQAGIYAADEFLAAQGREDLIKQAERDLNDIYMKTALNRDKLFKTVKVSAAGNVSTAVFYGISASVLVLLLLGIPAAPFVRPYERVMEQKLYMLGIGRWKRTAVRTVCLTFLFLLASLLPFFFCIYKEYMEANIGNFLLWFLICAAAAGWILFLYELSGSGQAGILVLFVSTVVMLFMAGGFVPAVFLPEQVRMAGQLTPAALLMEGVESMVTGGSLIPGGKLLLMEALAFVAASVVRRDYE